MHGRGFGLDTTLPIGTAKTYAACLTVAYIHNTNL